MSNLTVTLKRSAIGRTQDQRATLRGLGLRKLHQTVVVADTPSIRGMVKKVLHLVEVQETAAN
jgi:large subunit ribosomal protein L30